MNMEDDYNSNENNIGEIDTDESIYSYSSAVRNELDNAFPTEYKEFTEEEYKILNKNLILYKDGNAEAIQYIVSVFHRFIKKYTNFICYGNVENYKAVYRKEYNKSLTKFIGLFMPKEKKAQITTTLEKNRLFAETCAKIQKLFSKFEYWDIYNELVCTLLNMANKYKIPKEGDKYYKINGTFHMYVAKCFHFDAYNALKKMVGDPLTHLETYSIEDDLTEDDVCAASVKTKQEDVSSMNNLAKKIVLKDTDTEKIIEHMMIKADRQKALNDSDKLILKEAVQDTDPYEDNSLNFNWTNGSTCSEMFKCLSSYEREILVLSYTQNKTDSEIANIYGCHRITIIKHKKIAIEKVRKQIERENKL